MKSWNLTKNMQKDPLSISRYVLYRTYKPKTFTRRIVFCHITCGLFIRRSHHLYDNATILGDASFQLVEIVCCVLLKWLRIQIGGLVNRLDGYVELLIARRDLINVKVNRRHNRCRGVIHIFSSHMKIHYPKDILRLKYSPTSTNINTHLHQTCDAIPPPILLLSYGSENTKNIAL